VTVVKIGLTGGIASGKSAAQRFFEQLGVQCIDHDRIAREVVEPGTPGLQRLVELLGNTILTAEGRLDRQQLKQHLFNDVDLKRRVEAILHPLVFQASEKLFKSLTYTQPYILVVSPLLIESGSARSLTQLIVVDIDPALQLKRLLARDTMTANLAKSIIASQATREQRCKAADFILNNDAGLNELEQQVNGVHQQLLIKLKSSPAQS